MNGSSNQGLPPGSGAGGDGGFDNQIDSLLQLVTARARGQVGSEVVENAISQLLRQQQHQPQTTHQPPTGTAPGAAPATASTRVGEKAVVEDDDDYDDLEDDTPNRKPPADGGSRGTKRRRTSGGSDSGNEGGGGGGGGTEESGAEMAEIDQSKQWDELDAIPLGRQGAKMMVTFGDGRNPRPKTVEAALLVCWCKKSSVKYCNLLQCSCLVALFIVTYANHSSLSIFPCRRVPDVSSSSPSEMPGP